MPIGAFKLNAIAKYAAPSGIRTAKTITVNGGAVIDTATKKYGTGSVKFVPASSSYLSMPNPGDLSFGTGNFTVEAWVYFLNQTSDCSIFGGPVQTSSFDLRRVGDGTIRIGRTNTAWDVTVSNNPAANTWHHLAVARSGTTIKMFLNGTQIYTGTNSISYAVSTTGYVGGRPGESVFMNGYIDELRVSNTARYTANFTAPAAAFTDDSNTLLLIHGDGANGSTAITDDNS